MQTFVLTWSVLLRSLILHHVWMASSRRLAHALQHFPWKTDKNILRSDILTNKTISVMQQ